MNVLALYRNFGAADLRNVRRDSLLLWVAAAPLLVALLFRFGLPPLSALLERELGFSLAPYTALLMSFFILTAPGMIGMVIGFLLLDERDEQVLTALLVTPVPLGGYLAYRLSVPLVLGFVLSVGLYPVTGLTGFSFGAVASASLLGALSGPVTALFLAATAENKVAGFAIVKVLNTVNMLPVAAYFLDPPLQYAAGIIPAFWPMKMLWVASAGEPYWPYALAGLVVSGAVLALLLRRFSRVLHR